jgi:sporulation protein YlmC with PRC-barrel domain
MFQTRQLGRALLVLALTSALSGYALAAKPYNKHGNDQFSASQSRTDLSKNAYSNAHQGTLIRASKLIGKEVRSSAGERLGKIHDIVLTPDLQSVSYVVVSRGGFLGIGHELHAVPWSDVRVGVGDSYILPLTKDQFIMSKGFMHGYWPTTVTLNSSGQIVYPATTRQESRDVQHQRVSKLIGMNVKDPQGKTTGDIRDMVIDLNTGQIAYNIVSFGGFFGVNPEYAAVPSGAITLQPSRNVARLNVDSRTLRANAFAPSQWPDLSDSSYAQRIDRIYGVTPGVALGYVPPTESTAPARMETPGARATAPEERATVPEERAAISFNPANVHTINGTVMDVGKFLPAQAGLEGLQLRVKADDGKTYIVFLGPRDYITQQNFLIASGDRVTATGADAKIGSRSVLLASQIKSNDQSLQLRDANGKPLWTESGTATRNQSANMGYVPPSEDMNRTPSSAGATNAQPLKGGCNQSPTRVE